MTSLHHLPFTFINHSITHQIPSPFHVFFANFLICYRKLQNYYMKLQKKLQIEEFLSIWSKKGHHGNPSNYFSIILHHNLASPLLFASFHPISSHFFHFFHHSQTKNALHHHHLHFHELSSHHVILKGPFIDHDGTLFPLRETTQSYRGLQKPYRPRL